ncbi:MAG: arginyltransferase, partial [Pseudomonadota bacterium]
AVTDQTDTGLSAVYTYFDPALHDRSLGTLAIMEQIALTRSMNLEYLYLGYWISGSDKMKYKSYFTPQERYISDEWIKVERL